MSEKTRKRARSPTLLLRRRRRLKRQTTLLRFFERLPCAARPQPTRAPIVAATTGRVVALCDTSRTALAPWAAAGYECCYVASRSAAEALIGNGERPVFACAFPDATDLSIAGARWFKQKREKNPQFQEEAAAVFEATEALFRRWGCPYFLEGPAVGRLRRLWRAPDVVYDPCDFGGWLPPEEEHPAHPDIIPCRDAYRRASGLWIGGGYRQPAQRAVEPQWRYFFSVRTGKRRRMNPVIFARGADGRAARSCPPRGFTRAVYARLTGRTAPLS